MESESKAVAREKLRVLRAKIGRRRCSPQRLCLWLFALAVVSCVVQVALFLSTPPGEQESTAAQQPTAQAAEAEDDSDVTPLPPLPPSSVPPPSAPANSAATRSDSSGGGGGGGGDDSDAPRRATSRRDNASSRAFDWNFGPPTHAPGTVTMHGCLGQGTYGVALNASAGGTSFVLKLPILRHWGFKFARAEALALRALNASIAGGSASIRHVVRLHGHSSVAVRWLLALAERGARDSEPVVSDDESALVAAAAHEDDPPDTRWACVNTSDLRHALASGVERLPALLLEELSSVSVFKWLASVAAPESASALGGVDVTRGGAAARPLTTDAQKRLFRTQIDAATRAQPPIPEAFHHGLVLLSGVAHGLHALHRARVLHRDLTEPGKNALLKRDAVGLTTALIDLSQAEVCPSGRGAAGRSVDMYAFGNIVFFACYGHVVHSLPWTRYSCTAAPKGLGALRATHHRLHPDGRTAPRTLFNRCHERLRAPLDALMQYCWAPALAAADADVASTTGMGTAGEATATRGVGEAAARLNHTWPVVIAQLDAMRATRVPLFRFM